MLREVIVKMKLKIIDTQEGMIVEALLDSGVMKLVIRLKFAKKQEFKKDKKPNIYKEYKWFLQQRKIY